MALKRLKYRVDNFITKESLVVGVVYVEIEETAVVGLQPDKVGLTRLLRNVSHRRAKRSTLNAVSEQRSSHQLRQPPVFTTLVSGGYTMSIGGEKYFRMGGQNTSKYRRPSQRGALAKFGGAPSKMQNR